MALNFYFDHVTEVGVPYPNLGHVVARPGQPQWHKFDDQWPFVSHFRPWLYLREAAQPTRLITPNDQEPWESAWYPIQLGWFDFCIDYIRQIPDDTLKLIHQGKLKILFCYHEGDNPHKIVQRLEELQHANGLADNSWRFISSNSAASDLLNALYFNDHESFFRLVNRKQRAAWVNTTNHELKYVFSCLVRRHQDWRLAFMADLWHERLLDQSYWSYNTAELPLIFDAESLPVNAALMPNLVAQVESFKTMTPKFCDDMTSDQHNNHTNVNTEAYTKSMCNIIFETNFDNDSSGVFITEKTWKSIKFGQPFVVVSAAHTLKTLRNHGYKVFDDVIDNSYDEIVDNTQRWKQIVNTLKQIKSRDAAEWWRSCHADMLHNQKLFEKRRTSAVADLVEFLKHE